MTTVGDVVAQLERWYDPAWAEPWDTVGLFSGDPGRTVGAVHVAVDPTEPVALEAAAHGAGLLVTHHPLFLGGATSVARTGPKGRTLALLDALYVAHTNADVADPGVSDALAAALGVTGLVPLQPQDDPLDRRAARPSTRGLGRIGTLPESLALQDFCGHVADRLPRTAWGVRASGDPDASVRTVAVAGGACLDLADLAAAAGADVLVTSDAKHHRAQESPIPVVDVAHWAGEWPWTVAVGERLRGAFPGLPVTVSDLVTDPWTTHRAGSRS